MKKTEDKLSLELTKILLNSGNETIKTKGIIL